MSNSNFILAINSAWIGWIADFKLFVGINIFRAGLASMFLSPTTTKIEWEKSGEKGIAQLTNRLIQQVELHNIVIMTPCGFCPYCINFLRLAAIVAAFARVLPLPVAPFCNQPLCRTFERDACIGIM